MALIHGRFELFAGQLFGQLCVTSVIHRVEMETGLAQVDTDYLDCSLFSTLLHGRLTLSVWTVYPFWRIDAVGWSGVDHSIISYWKRLALENIPINAEIMANSF